MSEPTIMKGLPYVPLDPQWLAESPAFASSNPRLVRAVMRLLAHAWGSSPAGSLPSSFTMLANISNLTEVEIGEHHDDLFSGWTLKDGRLYFTPMSALCERISARYGDTLASIADQAAAVIQSPEDFVLTPTEVSSPAKGKHRIPKGWRLTDALRVWLIAHGFPTEQDHDFIVTKFTSHYRSRGEMMLDWDQAFQNYALKENRSGLPSNASRLPPFAAAPGSRAARFGNAGQVAREHNESVFDRVQGRMHAPGASRV